MNHNEQIVLYAQLQYIPHSLVIPILPELDNPSSELQYQLLKLEYTLLSVSNGITEAWESICQIMRESVVSLSDNFRELGECLFDYSDDELLAYDHDIPNCIVRNKKQEYNYVRDLRNETRRYLRNRIY